MILSAVLMSEKATETPNMHNCKQTLCKVTTLQTENKG